MKILNMRMMRTPIKVSWMIPFLPNNMEQMNKVTYSCGLKSGKLVCLNMFCHLAVSVRLDGTITEEGETNTGEKCGEHL